VIVPGCIGLAVHNGMGRRWDNEHEHVGRWEFGAF
jgi:hypothetical protein